MIAQFAFEVGLPLFGIAFMLLGLIAVSVAVFVLARELFRD